MSEQEKKSGRNVAGGSSVVMVEQSAGSRHMQPYRPTELQEEAAPDLHHKRSRAPAVPSVAEELKNVSEDSTPSEIAISSEKHKHIVAKKLSSSTKRRGSSPEAITLAPVEVEMKKGAITPPPQPIPAQAGAVASEASGMALKGEVEKKFDEDSITEEITELRTPETVKKHSEWSDDEEAGGLPRSDSRASRVSRAVRQLFCCGMPLEAPSEDNISYHLSPSRESLLSTSAGGRGWPAGQMINKNAVTVQKESAKENKEDKSSNDAQNIVTETLPQLKDYNKLLSTSYSERKKISWCDMEYLEKVKLMDLGTRSQPTILEKKASIGPRYRPGMPLQGPSGIIIFLPKKSKSSVSEEIKLMQSGISITLSKKCLSKPKSHTDNQKMESIEEKDKKESKKHEFNLRVNIPCVKLMAVLRETFDLVRSKIRNIWNA